MSETCQKLAFTHPIVVLKSGLKNNWMKKLDRVNRPLNQLLVKEKEFLSCCQVFSIEENIEPAGYVAVYNTLLFISR